jgi:hypothetical protein
MSDLKLMKFDYQKSELTDNHSIIEKETYGKEKYQIKKVHHCSIIYRSFTSNLYRLTLKK